MEDESLLLVPIVLTATATATAAAAAGEAAGHCAVTGGRDRQSSVYCGVASSIKKAWHAENADQGTTLQPIAHRAKTYKQHAHDYC